MGPDVITGFSFISGLGVRSRVNMDILILNELEKEIRQSISGDPRV